MNADLTALLLDAKCQYVVKLSEILCPFASRVIHDMRVESTKETSWFGDEEKVFRKKLREVPSWNTSIIAFRTNEVVSQYPFFNDLIAAAIVTQTKILSSIRLSVDAPDVKLKIPSSEDFISAFYSEVARVVYYNPGISLDTSIVNDITEKTVRQLIPFGDILQAYLAAGEAPAPPPSFPQSGLAAGDTSSESSESSISSSSSDDEDNNSDVNIDTSWPGSTEPVQPVQQQAPAPWPTPSVPTQTQPDLFPDTVQTPSAMGVDMHTNPPPTDQVHAPQQTQQPPSLFPAQQPQPGKLLL